ncbi:hypothetical protein VTK26DRAFT_8331 [Humicola hyalothermophila]
MPCRSGRVSVDGPWCNCNPLDGLFSPSLGGRTSGRLSVQRMSIKRGFPEFAPRRPEMLPGRPFAAVTLPL